MARNIVVSNREIKVLCTLKRAFRHFAGMVYQNFWGVDILCSLDVNLIFNHALNSTVAGTHGFWDTSNFYQKMSPRTIKLSLFLFPFHTSLWTHGGSKQAHKMQTLDQISMKFETWAIFMSLYGMVCQKDIGSISPYPQGISANPFNIKFQANPLMCLTST